MLEAEWQKLERTLAWDVTKVIPKAQVIAKPKRLGKEVHSGQLMDLCYLKSSQID